MWTQATYLSSIKLETWLRHRVVSCSTHPSLLTVWKTSQALEVLLLSQWFSLCKWATCSLPIANQSHTEAPQHFPRKPNYDVRELQPWKNLGSLERNRTIVIAKTWHSAQFSPWPGNEREETGRYARVRENVLQGEKNNIILECWTVICCPILAPELVSGWNSLVIYMLQQ